MKKLKNLGKTLNKKEQKTINGGWRYCNSRFDCYGPYLGPGDVTCRNGSCFYY
jgi:hypothetical protein